MPGDSLSQALFKTEQLGVTVNITNSNGTGSASISPPAKSGYTCVGIVGFSVSSPWHWVTAAYSDSVTVKCRDDKAGGSVPVYVRLLYIANR